MARTRKALDGWRTCTVCQKTLKEHTDNFKKGSRGYYYSYCIPCHKNKLAEYRRSKGIPTRESIGYGKKRILPDEEGYLVCRKCGNRLEANKENFFFVKGHFISECKPCRAEYDRIQYKLRKTAELRNKMLKEAAARKEPLSTCLRCNEDAPESSFVEYDTNVYYQGKVLIRGYKYICGMCHNELNDKIYNGIEELIKYANESKRSKLNKGSKGKRVL